MKSAIHTRILTAGELVRDHPMRESWQQLVDGSSSLYVMYQSPLWWDHLSVSGEHDRLRLVCWHDSHGELVGVAPCWQANIPWTYLNWRRWFRPFPGPTWHLLGGEPLLAHSRSMSEALWHQLLAGLGSGSWLYCKSIRSHVQPHDNGAGPSNLSSLFNISIGGVRPLHGIELQSEWETYARLRLRRQLSTLRRKERQLVKYCAGPVTLVSIQTAQELQRWLPSIASVRPFTRHHHRRQSLDSSRLVDLAQRGVLQSYLLAQGDRVLAFVIGYQYAHVYHYADVGFDTRLETYSPGAVLLVRLLQDLFAQGTIQRFNFGVGDAEYKRRFATFAEQDQSLLITANTWSNRLRCSALQMANWISHLREKRRG